jgi:ubiquinone/menaquinone biosynthesis C-methylase UbiE
VIGRWIAPARRRGVELLDLADTPDGVRAAAMRDLERSNRMFGGRLAVHRAARAQLAPLGAGSVVLDVATGTGDIPAALRARYRDIFFTGLDGSTALASAAASRLDAAVAGDALRLPFRDRSVDLVICSQALHHFFGDDARRLVAELHRVARRGVVLADLRRSPFAAAGFWIAATALRFHPVTRADGVTSVFRGFTADELRDLVRGVTGVTPVIRRGLFWRLSATWVVPQDSITRR